MQTQAPKQYCAATHRAVAYGGAIEWEELPSLAQNLMSRPAASGAPGAGVRDVHRGPVWNETRPAALDSIESAATPALAEFRESLGGGLVTREVHGSDVFAHYFGAPPAR